MDKSGQFNTKQLGCGSWSLECSKQIKTQIDKDKYHKPPDPLYVASVYVR